MADISETVRDTTMVTMERACLGGSVGWDTVRTDRNGLPEKLG